MMKRCNICGVEKSFDCFSIKRSSKDGRHYNCRPCDVEKVRAWYQANRDKALDRSRRRREQKLEHLKALDRERYHKNRHHHLEARRQYYLKNKEKISERSKAYKFHSTEKGKAYKKAWNDRNRGKIALYGASRRRTIMQATPKWLSAIQHAQMQEFYDIAVAKSVQTNIPHHVDHIVPLLHKMVSGLHVPWNLRVVPASDNCSKRNALPSEQEYVAREF